MKVLFSIAAVVGAMLLMPMTSFATTYFGNGAAGFGGTLGVGSLTVSNNVGAGTTTFTFNPAGGFGGNDVVVYLDTVPATGFSDTSQFSDNGDPGREAISGYNASGPYRTLATFPTGFGADYAISFENNVFTGVFGLASGGNNSLNYVTGNTPTAGGPYTITLNDSQIGLTPTQSFSFVGSLISTTAYRSNETLGASATTPEPGAGFNAGNNGSVLFTSADTFIPAPEPGSLVPMLMGMAAIGGLIAVRRRTAA